MGSSFESGSRQMLVRCSMLWAMVPDIWDVVNDNDKVDMMGKGGKRAWDKELAVYRGIV